MKLEYTSPEKNLIKATLTASNKIGNIQGPAEIMIPAVSGNTEYDDIIQRNLKIKNYAPPVFIPSGVSPLQARKALRQAGLLETFNQMMSQASEEIQEEWEYCTVVMRDNPNIAQFAQALELSSSQIDELFVLASTL